MSVVTDDAGRGIGSALHGRTGARTQDETISLLGEVTGTVAFGSEAGWSLVVIRDGTVVDRQPVERAPSAGAVDLPFVLHEHDVRDGAGNGDEAASRRGRDVEAARSLPELPALLPEARWPGLVCIPHGPDVRLLPAGLVSLPALAAHLGGTAFHGVVAAHGGAGSAAAVAVGGRFVAAVGDRSEHELGGPNALRLLARHAIDPDAPALRLVPLPHAPLAAVAAVMLGRQADGGDELQVGEHATVLSRDGTPWLHVAYPSAERLGRFAAGVAVADLPALALPEEPLDWETRSYQLTLRGRDVLDPMTEVAMRFAAEYGTSGRKLLLALQRGLDAETAAAELGLDLDEVGVRLRRLEREGFVRVAR